MTFKPIKRNITVGNREITIPAGGWMPRSYQKPLWDYIENGGKHAVAVWPRRHGKDITWMNIIASQMFRRVGLYWIVYPQLKQGRKIAWTGMDKTGRPFLAAIPEETIVSKTNDDMRIQVINGSVFQVVGADNPDSMRGANPIGIVYSEWSMMDPIVRKIMTPILKENDGWEGYGYTPMGANHGLDLLNFAKSQPTWFWDHKTAVDLKVLSPEKLREARLEAEDEAMFQQEYMCSFTAPLSGAYYMKEIMKAYEQERIGVCKLDPNKPVHTAWDLGYGDATAIWLFQIINRVVRFVGFVEKEQEGLPYFIRWLKEYQDKWDVMWGQHFGPWDLSHGEFTTGKTRFDTAREMGIRFTVVAKHGTDEGIDAVRNFLPLCQFDEVECARGLECLKSYRSERDTENKVFKKVPVHDWASHAADAMRIAAWGLRLSGETGHKIGSVRARANGEKRKAFREDYDPRNI